MSQKVLGGKSYKRYPDPSVSNLPNEYGLYPWSAFTATLSQFEKNGANIEPVVVTAGGEFYALLFTSDIPAICKADTAVFGGANPFPRAYTNVLNYTTFVGLVTTPGGSTVADNGGKYGQVSFGYTGAAKDVPCYGFPTVGYAISGGEDSGTVTLDVWANAATICSPISANQPAATPQPIILRYDQYTNAIRDNNNIITIAGVSSIVVGLHNLGAV